MIRAVQGGSFRGPHTNSGGEVLLSAYTQGTNEWKDFYKYDSAGRMLLHALPSAVTTYFPSSPQLLDSPAGGDVEGLANDAGLIEVMTYETTSTTATTSTAGNVLGYLKSTARAHGENQLAGGIQQQAYTYLQRPVTTTYVIKASTSYRDDGAAQAVLTTNNYTFYSGTDRIQAIDTHLPVVSASQNGPGTDDVETTVFDTFGRVVWQRDADGYLAYTAYESGNGAISQSIVDADPAQVTSPPIGAPPRGATSTPLHLRTQIINDGLGRPRFVEDPRFNVTETRYDDAAQAKRVTVLPPVTLTAASDDPPAQVTRDDRANGTLDVFEVIRNNSTGEPIGTITKLTHTHFNTQDQIDFVERYAKTANLSYNTTSGALTGLGNGTDTRYRTEYGYDPRGRQDRVSAGRDAYTGSMSATNPTITRTVFDGLSRPTQTWIGTNDSGWTPSTPGSNMTLVSANEYDGGGVGDGNLTAVTQYPDGVLDGQPGNALPDRVTRNIFDWRDRLVASKAGVETTEATDVNRPISYTKYDNLDRPVAQYVYDGDQQNITSSGQVPIQPSASLMRAATLTQYDARGRVFRTSTFSVDQSAGASGLQATYTADQFAGLTYADLGGSNFNALRSDAFYDGRDNQIEQHAPGGLVTKMRYDGASRLTREFTTDGGGDAAIGNSNAWNDARSVTGDSVLEQIETTYDKNGNVTLTTTRQRHHDDTGTDDLSSSSARVNFVGNWYDEANRLETTINFGNNGNDSTSNLSNGSVIDVSQPPPARVASDGWDIFLRSDYAYHYAPYSDAYASSVTVTDPRDIDTEQRMDSLGRTVETWEAIDTPTLAPAPTVDTNRGTLSQYNGFDQVTQQTSRSYSGGGSRDFSTHYTYGVAKGGNIYMNSSSLLTTVLYDTATGGDSGITDQEQYTGYTTLGEVTGKTERNTSTHLYTYSILGQQLTDLWNNTGIFSGKISTWAGELKYEYDTLGRVTTGYTLDTSLAQKNKVVRQYDGLGNLLSEQTTINEAAYGIGGVGATVTDSVQYAYEFVPASNYSRLQQTTYPNNRVLKTEYGVSGSLNFRISRVEDLAEGSPSSPLESYTYLGLATVVRRRYDGYGGPARTEQTFIDDNTWILNGDDFKDTGDVDDGGTNDPYAGLDRFGRVIEQSWTVGGASVVARWFAYDANGNPLYSIDPRTGFDFNHEFEWRDELYQTSGATAANAYDKLNRMQFYKRGAVYSSDTRPDSIATANLNYSDNYSTSGQGNYVRTTNATQEKTFQGEVPSSTMSAPAGDNPRADMFAKFDAWGRLAVDTAAQLTQVSGVWKYYTDGIDERDFEYDAFGRRIVERYIGKNANEQYSLYLFNDASGRVIEEEHRRADSAASTISTLNQYVWSDAGPDLMVLRDSNADGNSSSGDYGFTGSGLEQRLWVEQGPDGSVWEVSLQDGSSTERESYVYTPEGDFVVVWGVDYTGPHLPRHSQYDWRYLWKGGRAEIYPYSDASSAYMRYDGLLLMPDGTEHNVAMGSPFGEDIYAYYRSNNAFVQWTYEQPQDRTAGNGGQYIRGQAMSLAQMRESEPGWWGTFWGALPAETWNQTKQRGRAIGGAVKEMGFALADIANDYVYTESYWRDRLIRGDKATGFQFYRGSLSSLGKAIDTHQVDPLSWSYVGMSAESVGNAVSFGAYDQIIASVQLTRGRIGWEEWGDRMAVGGAFELLAAATMPKGANINVGDFARAGAGRAWRIATSFEVVADRMYSTPMPVRYVRNLGKLRQVLRDFNSERFQIGDQVFQLDKPGLKHILQRHHPEFWTGRSTAVQSFLDRGTTVSQIVGTIREVLNQNRAVVLRRGTNSMYPVRGVVGGRTYQVGINRGRIGQFYRE